MRGATPEVSRAPPPSPLAQDDATTGWPSLGWAPTKSGPRKASWKVSFELRPMREPILKVLLICGCRFAGQ